MKLVISIVDKHLVYQLVLFVVEILAIQVALLLPRPRSPYTVDLFDHTPIRQPNI